MGLCEVPLWCYICIYIDIQIEATGFFAKLPELGNFYLQILNCHQNSGINKCKEHNTDTVSQQKTEGETNKEKAK